MENIVLGFTSRTDEQNQAEGVVQLADQEYDETDSESELSGDCVGEGFYEDDETEDEEVDGLTYSALTLTTTTVSKKTKPTESANHKKVKFKKEQSKQNNNDLDKTERMMGKKIEVGLQQTVLNVQNPETKQHMTVNALIDTGSNHTAISRRLAEKLKLDGLITPYKVITFGGGIFEQDAKMVKVNLRSIDGKQERRQVVRSVGELCGEMKVWPWNRYKNCGRT